MADELHTDQGAAMLAEVKDSQAPVLLKVSLKYIPTLFNFLRLFNLDRF